MATSTTTPHNGTTFNTLRARLKDLDKGAVLMNIGAITGLTGFMMSDVLLLRCLSICSSMCGITYNFTRSPKQINACAWGGIYISVNLFMIFKLLTADKGIHFSQDELELYQSVFQPHGVSMHSFKNMMNFATWETLPKGGVIQNAGKPMTRVVVLKHGSAVASRQGRELYFYKPGTGGIIGGTALVDPRTTRHNYPNEVAAALPNTVVVSWDRKKLQELMMEDHMVEASVCATLMRFAWGCCRYTTFLGTRSS